jgi:hypothetical protein
MKKRELPPLIAVAVILLGLSIASLALPDRTFSENENRYLQQAPRLTADRVLSGRFSEEAEKYESDQVALRDFWMGAASTLRKLAGKQDIGGVYLGEDGYLFARVTEEDFDQRQYEKNLRAVADFFDAHSDLDCRILLAPSPADVLAGKLPDGAPMYDAAPRHELLAETVGAGRVVDVRDALAAVPEPYYRTDHHWTTEGARAAYETWCGATGRAGHRAELSPAGQPGSFRGTLYSKVLLPDCAWDDVWFVRNPGVASMDCDGTVTEATPYDFSKLDGKDKYALFQGGNWAKTVIDTSTENGRRLLVVKDSFANCFVPFLAGEPYRDIPGDFERIVMLDLRYFADSVPELMAEEGITDVLVLYEMTNFAADRNLFKLNEGE